MKRILVSLVLVLAVAAFAFADHPNKLGLGIVGGSGYGYGNIGSDVGFAFKLSSLPVYWQLNLHLNSGYLGLGATGDVYLKDQNLLEEGSFALDWFLGLGGYASIGLGNDLTAAVGARVPVGLSWHITDEFELWLDIVPSLGIGVVPFYFPDWNVGGEVGFRVWLK